MGAILGECSAWAMGNPPYSLPPSCDRHAWGNTRVRVSQPFEGFALVRSKLCTLRVLSCWPIEKPRGRCSLKQGLRGLGLAVTAGAVTA